MQTHPGCACLQASQAVKSKVGANDRLAASTTPLNEGHSTGSQLAHATSHTVSNLEQRESEREASSAHETRMWLPQASVTTVSSHSVTEGAHRVPHVVCARTSRGPLHDAHSGNHSARADSTLSERTRGQSTSDQRDTPVARVSATKSVGRTGSAHLEVKVPMMSSSARDDGNVDVDDDNESVEQLLNFADALDPEVLDDAI